MLSHDHGETADMTPRSRIRVVGNAPALARSATAATSCAIGRDSGVAVAG
jgi:hypothetical protein